MSRRSLQAPLAVLLLGGGVLLSAATGTGTIGGPAGPDSLAALDAPVFHIDVRPDRVHLRGMTVSAGHESRLLRLAGDQFAQATVRSGFRPGAILASDWESRSNKLLYALAATESARAVMREDSVEIRGATANAAAFRARVEFLRDALRPNTTLVTNVVTIDASASQQALCRRAFATLTARPISFKQSSAEIRTSSFATLDGIADFANDCRAVNIAVTGHTDASGDETWNRRLSLLRAQAVADHLVRAGVHPRRLQVRGLGSAAPIADNATAYGRSLNRRIEFSLL